MTGEVRSGKERSGATDVRLEPSRTVSLAVDINPILSDRGESGFGGKRTRTKLKAFD